MAHKLDYKYHFEKLLDAAAQAVENTDFKKRKIISFAAFAVLRNAVNYYRELDKKGNECIVLNISFTEQEVAAFLKRLQREQSWLQKLWLRIKNWLYTPLNPIT